MKKNYTCLFTILQLLFFGSIKAQRIAPSTLNVSGGSFASNNLNVIIDWSFGESALINTYSLLGNEFILTNGVLQPCTDIVARDPAFPNFGLNEYKLFPNITNGPFEIDFFFTVPGVMKLQLTDAAGKTLETRTLVFNCCDRIQRFDISGKPKGFYFINAYFEPTDNALNGDKNFRRKSTFKIVKGGL